jgi:hypothetical protein
LWCRDCFTWNRNHGTLNNTKSTHALTDTEVSIVLGPFCPSEAAFTIRRSSITLLACGDS